MSEQVGSIVYTVDVNTSDAIAAERTISASTTKIADNFKRTETQVTKSTRAVNQALTNTSYQIQDIAVQLAGGQNPFLVMAQQIPQIAVGMGAMGAAIGAAVAILGGLAMAVFDTKTALEKAQEAIERVQASITVGANGIANYTERMRGLRVLSESLTQVRLSEVIRDQTKAFRELSEVGLDAFDKAGTFYSNLSDTIAKETGGSIVTIGKLQDQFRMLAFQPTAEKAQLLANTLGELNKQVPENNKKGRELVTTLSDLVQKYLEGVVAIDAAKGAMANSAQITAQASSGFRDLAEGLAASIVKYTDGERAAYDYGLRVKGFTDKEREAILALYDKEQALKKAKEAQDAVTKSLSDYLDKEAEQSAREEEKRQRSREQLASQVSAVGLTPLQEIEKRYQDELAILQAAREQGVEIIGTYNDREIQLAKEKADAIAQFERSQQLGQKLVSVETENALSSLGNAFGNFAEIAKQGGKESFEAYKDMAIAQALISTFLAANNALATPAPPPIPQMLAASIAGLGLLNVANIRKQQYAGAREFGGPVTNGKSYLVGEREPEIFTPGRSGSITKLSDLTSGGGVTINNYAAGVEVEPRFDQGRLVEIAVKQAKREIIRDMSNNGQFARSVKANTNTKFTGSR